MKFTLIIILLSTILSLFSISFGEKQILDLNMISAPLFVYSCDLDNDGDDDFLIESLDGHLDWFENINILEEMELHPIIFPTIPYEIKEIFDADFDNDNDLDIVVLN
ncbi:MAG: hypothetical protein U9N34_10620, partial [Candidatus Cloacimonadota bacterium]|nr:hypothetical protein [Candidatus Cloacimonadota bacterium]